jgi:transcriptional regulator with XRE-family HTH domain
MTARLSPKQIGKRIVELRKLKGYSQEDLAKFLEIPRSSVAQMELGNRNVSVIELIKLSDALGFSLDKLLAKEYKTEKKLRM